MSAFGGKPAFSCPDILRLPMDQDYIWNLIAKRLAGEATDGELKELETALRRNPDLHYTLEAMEDMWRNQPETDSGQAEIAFQKHLDRMSSAGLEFGGMDLNSSNYKSVHYKYWKILAFAVTGFLLVIMAVHFMGAKNSTVVVPKTPWEVTTRNGTKTSLLLPDGSTVWLNAGSRLSYDSLYGVSLREVTLSGEGYFDVVRNPNKPFIIHTGKINIKVLGTIFNVKSYPGEQTIETSLIRGSIEVSFPSLSAKKIILKANQKLIINKMEPMTIANANHIVSSTVPLIKLLHISRIGSDSSIAETGWMQNRLYFNDQSFRELLNNMERKYGVSFQLADSSLDKIHFTGSFQNETVLQALDALRMTAEESTEDFIYEIQGNKVFIYNNTKGVHSNQAK
jgi:transmembrane sensor